MVKTRTSGFTFIKHGLSLGYPVKESIQSIEPLCDEVVINVGFGQPECSEDDGTYEYLRDHFSHSKFKFLKSYWDPALTSGGAILAQQTNLALQACQGSVCQYIQSDELLHEKDLPLIHENMIEMLRNPQIEGLVFHYLHFYGSSEAIRHTRLTYRQEVRTIRNGLGIRSYRDAQGFRHKNNTKLLCQEIGATVYHYGWARPLQLMQRKTKAMNRLYHDKQKDSEEFEYRKVWGLRPFIGSHPQVVQEWIDKNKTAVNPLKLKPDYGLKDVRLMVSDFIERLSGYRIGEYKNFKTR